MRKSKQKMSRRKKTIGATAVVVAVALMFAGTFAWTDFNQHATNPFLKSTEPDVTLNDAFIPESNWPMNVDVDKKISVTNTQESNMPVYVRVQFKELLMTYSVDYTYIAEGADAVLFATYASGSSIGEYMKWDSQEEAEADLATNGYDYTVYPVTVSGVTTYYARTTSTEIKNGIYGKPMIDRTVANDSKTLVKTFGTDTNGAAPNNDYTQKTQHSYECDYDVHAWNTCGITDGTGDDIHNYVEWNLGEQVVRMADWITAGMPLGDFWVLDADGWAYWANALEPNTTTANIMESVKLTNMPGQELEYYIHVDMEALTFDDFAKWTDKTGDGGTLIGLLDDVTASAWVDNGDGTATRYTRVDGIDGSFKETTVIIGLDGEPGTGDDNMVVNPAGTVLKENISLSYDGTTPYVALGNAFNLYGGTDGKIGTTDDIIKGFGSYMQAATDSQTGTKTALNWRLLDIQGAQAIIIADTVVDNLKFNLTTTAGNLWSTSNLRGWLNSDGVGQNSSGDKTGFYNTAFSAAEKAKIATTTISMPSETFLAYCDKDLSSTALGTEFVSFTTVAQAGTSDNKVWALSSTEAWKYFGQSTISEVSTDHTNAFAKGNEYAKDKGTYLNPNPEPWLDNSNYWLRSSGQDANRAGNVGTYGAVTARNRVVNDIIGARPAITVNIG